MYVGSLVERDIVRSYGNKNHKSVAEMTTPRTSGVTKMTLDEYIAAHLARAQFEIGRDLCEGTIYYDFSDRPLAYRGSLNLANSVNAVIANTELAA